MKILIVASKFPPEYTGPGVRIPKLYENIAARLGVTEIHVLCNGVEHTKTEHYKYQNMSVQRVSVRSSKFVKNIISKLPRRFCEPIIYFLETIISLRALREYKDIDFIHIVGNSGATAAAIRWASKKNIPVMMELVTAEARPWQRYLFFFRVRPHANSVIVSLTHKVAEICKQDKKRKGEIWFRPNPIDDSEFFYEREKKQAYRAALRPYEHRDIVMCSVAKIMPQKNQFLLVRMMRFLPDQYKLVIAGPLVIEGAFVDRDNAYLNEIKNYIAEHKLENRIQMHLDFVKAGDYMKASDIYMMPAWNEGFGTPMIEAMACGLPVIANKNEIAFQEWVRDGENGFLCDIRSEQEWADAVNKISDMADEKRMKMSQEILSLAAKSKINDQYIALINKLMKRVHVND